MILILAVCLISVTNGATADASVKKATKKYTITTKSKPSKKSTSLSTYNKYTKHYYVLKEILKGCEKNGSLQEDEAYLKYLKYGAPGTPDDYTSLFVGQDYMTLAESRAASKQ